MSHGSFGTALNCMDGRAQDQIEDFVKNEAGVQYVDAITEPDIDGVLARQDDPTLLAHIQKKVGISVNGHGSKYIAVVGHGNHCAGNPVSKEQHYEEIQKAVDLVKSWVTEAVKVVGLYTESVDPEHPEGEWKVETVC